MSITYTNGLFLIMSGSINMNTDTFQIMLASSSYVGSPDHTTSSNYNTWECTGTGYSRKTLTFTGAGGGRISQDTTYDCVIFDADDVSWTTLTAGTISGAILIRSGSTNGTTYLICAVDTGGFPITTNGGDLTLTWSSNGIVRYNSQTS